MAGKKYGLDLGTQNFKIYSSGHGVEASEKNLVAIQRKKNIVAIGDAAYVMYERTPKTIQVTSPVKEGVIANLHDMRAVMEYLLKKISCSPGVFKNNSFYIAAPSSISEVGKRAYFNLISHSAYNTRNIYLVDMPIAAAIGEGASVMKKSGTMIVDIGAATTEISVLASGGIVKSVLLKIGGDTFNDAIRERIKKEYQLLIGDKTAEFLKVSIGHAVPTSGSSERVFGRDVVTGLPAEADIPEQLIYESIKRYLFKIAEHIVRIMEHIPPELMQDITNSGICFTGGGSLLPDMDILFRTLTKMKVNFSANPTESVVKGLGIIMENESYHSLLISVRDSIFD